ncbi:hypothetical protein Tco_0911648 [Tanacetum coccineum]|uniref:Uncharacterized protein n=1 Tax=Tanacetum coccineum TaxID=301880 RepID=A0ABQ5CXE3_9ASTR
MICHDEVKEKRVSKKRKLGHKEEAKSKEERCLWSQQEKDADLKICLHIAPLMKIKEDLKVIYELVMEEYKDKLPEGFDKMLWGDLMIMFNQGDTADFWDTQQNWKLISWKLHSSSGVHTIMTSTGLVIHMFVENRYPLAKEVLSQMLELKLETEEESSMALELIKFVKQQLEEFEDSNDDDSVTSDHEEAERV